MKKVFALITVIFAMANITQAGQENFGTGHGNGKYDPKAIYEALIVPEVVVGNAVGVGKLRKSVGGLSCTRSIAVYPKAVPKYECKISPLHSDYNFKLIYENLDVQETNVSQALGSSQMQKNIGGLNCTKSTPVVMNPISTYLCEIKK